MDNLPSLGYCPNCNEMMIAENGNPKCLNCTKPERPKHIVKPPPVTEVPTDAELARITGSAQPKAPITEKAHLVTTGGTAKDALEIMRNLPMPKDLKEFRQIKKIIKQLEKLVGEYNGD